MCGIRLGDSATNVNSCTSTLVPGVPPSTAVAWCRLESYRLGMEAERWTPYTTPDTLLHLITCNCRSGCERNCECRRSGLPCTSMCGFCAGHGCSNHDTSDDTSYGEDYTSGSDEDALDAAPVPKRRRR